MAKYTESNSKNFEYKEKVTDRSDEKIYKHFHSVSVSKKKMSFGTAYFLCTGKLIDEKTQKLNFQSMNLGKQGLKDLAKWINENVK